MDLMVGATEENIMMVEGELKEVQEKDLLEALYEMRYEEAEPEKVAINEAVEIARKYGGDDSPSFVNGILAKLVLER